MAEITVTATPYGPKTSDDDPSDYLHRCAKALNAAYEYECSLLIGGARQLQVNIPDEDAIGNGKRPVNVVPPQVVIDVNGAIEVMSDAAAAIAKYPSLAAELEDEGA